MWNFINLKYCISKVRIFVMRSNTKGQDHLVVVYHPEVGLYRPHFILPLLVSVHS